MLFERRKKKSCLRDYLNDDIMNELSFTSKPAYLVKLTGSSASSPAGLSIIDITFRLEHGFGGVEIDCISFRNSFTATLSVLAKQKVDGKLSNFYSKKHAGPWTLCLEKIPLMANPHELEGAEKRHTVTTDQFLAPMRYVQEVRLVLQQPSTTWKDFTLTELKFMGKLCGLDGTVKTGQSVDNKGPHTFLMSVGSRGSETLANEDASESVDSDMKNISAYMQEIVTLMHYYKTHATNVDKTSKFDIDGDYSLSMLSYT